jgi:hypothetical protein
MELPVDVRRFIGASGLVFHRNGEPMCRTRTATKNITVTAPDDVYRRARIRAAEQGRSVSALVAE